MLKILPPKNENFQIKNSYIFHISDQNIDCGYSLEPTRRGGSNEYPQSMFLSRNKKINVYPYKPQFYYIKWGLRGSKLYRRVLVMMAADWKWLDRYMCKRYNTTLNNICRRYDDRSKSLRKHAYSNKLKILPPKNIKIFR